MKTIYLILISTLLLINCGNELTKKKNLTQNEISDKRKVIRGDWSHDIDTTSKIGFRNIKEYLGREKNKDIIDNKTIREIEKDLNDNYSQRVHLPGINYITDSSSKKIKSELETTKKSIDSSLIEQEKSAPVSIQIVEENHIIFDKLLKKHVSSTGKVNYKNFKVDKQKLESYIKHMQVLYKDLKVWNKDKRLAYWINIYNANTIKLILDNYPVTSITKLKSGKPWDYKIIELGGKNYTLNDIENKIIRPRFKDPRIHFAVNCAAKSCPKLLNQAWTEHNIQRYLTKQTRTFLANTKENTITENKVVLSKIFEWYKVDFGADNAKLIAFINKYSNTKVNENADVSFKEYIWDLNL